MEIQFPVSVKPEREQKFEISVPDCKTSIPVPEQELEFCLSKLVPGSDS